MNALRAMDGNEAAGFSIQTVIFWFFQNGNPENLISASGVLQ